MRDAYWQAKVASGDAVIARRRLGDATALAVGVERRLKAGDLARTHFNQATGLRQRTVADIVVSRLVEVKGDLSAEIFVATKIERR